MEREPDPRRNESDHSRPMPHGPAEHASGDERDNEYDSDLEASDALIDADEIGDDALEFEEIDSELDEED